MDVELNQQPVSINIDCSKFHISWHDKAEIVISKYSTTNIASINEQKLTCMRNVYTLILTQVLKINMTFGHRIISITHQTTLSYNTIRRFDIIFSSLSNCARQ